MVKGSTTFILKLLGLYGLMGGSVSLVSPRFSFKDGKLGSCGPKALPPSGFLYVGNKMHKAFPLPVIEFLLPEEVPTASEENSHC
nr:hypothetical protein [Tanacetum cinerariifolium]